MLKVRDFFAAVLCITAFFCAAVAGTSSSAEAANEIIRIGVMNFTNRANGLHQQQSEGITDMFTRMLSNSQSIAIVERERLDAIGREHRFGMSGLVDPNTAGEIGKIAGCQYILLGAITHFDQKESTSGFGKLFQEKKREVNITIDMRVVDVSTSEVVLTMAETGRASSSAQAINLFDINQQDGPVVGLEGEAIINAVSKLCHKLLETVAGEYTHVISVAGKDVTLSVGSQGGARAGALYLVYADGPEIRDMNGRLLGRKNVNLAVVKVAELQNEFSVARVVENGGKIDLIRRGDKIMSISSGEAKSLADGKAFASSRPRGLSLESMENVDARLGDIAGAPSAPSSAIAPKRELENRSTDPSKVIATYGLSGGEANTRRIAHINIGKLKDKKQAYEKYVELAESYSGDYLAAYKAGETALALKKTDDAKKWFDRALSINPDYEPAQKAKAKLEK